MYEGWRSWSVVEDVGKIPKRRSSTGHFENYGYGRYETIDELKKDYLLY